MFWAACLMPDFLAKSNKKQRPLESFVDAQHSACDSVLIGINASNEDKDDCQRIERRTCLRCFFMIKLETSMGSEINEDARFTLRKHLAVILIS